MKSMSFDRFAGACALVAGIGGFGYSYAFIVLYVLGKSPALGFELSSALLLLGGVASSAVVVSLYNRYSSAPEAAFARWALFLGTVGMLGAAIHGGHDLAIVFHPPAETLPNDVPSPIDPRGLTTFGLTGIAFFILSWLMARGGGFPKGLGYLGYAVAILFVVLYLGRLIILDPTQPVVTAAAVLSGFIITPIWYIWLGVVLLREK
jgi:hypothetical protein